MSGFPVRTALFVSLALNLLVIGGAIGAVAAGVRIEQPGDAPVTERLPGPRAFMAALPAAARATVRNDLRQTAVQTHTLRETARQARQAVFDAARAEPYDANRMRSAFAHMREADAAVAAEFHNTVAESLTQMSAPERQRALEALRPRALAPAHSGAGPAGDRPAPGTFRERMRERWRERLNERRGQH